MEISNRVTSFFLPVFSLMFLTDEAYTFKAGSKREKLGQTPWWYYIFYNQLKCRITFLDSYFSPRSDSEKTSFKDRIFHHPFQKVSLILNFWWMNYPKQCSVNQFKKETLKDSKECRFLWQSLWQFFWVKIRLLDWCFISPFIGLQLNEW